MLSFKNARVIRPSSKKGKLTFLLLVDFAKTFVYFFPLIVEFVKLKIIPKMQNERKIFRLLLVNNFILTYTLTKYLNARIITT